MGTSQAGWWGHRCLAAWTTASLCVYILSAIAPGERSCSYDFSLSGATFNICLGLNRLSVVLQFPQEDVLKHGTRRNLFWLLIFIHKIAKNNTCWEGAIFFSFFQSLHKLRQSKESNPELYKTHFLWGSLLILLTVRSLGSSIHWGSKHTAGLCSAACTSKWAPAAWPAAPGLRVLLPAAFRSWELHLRSSTDYGVTGELGLTSQRAFLSLVLSTFWFFLAAKTYLSHSGHLPDAIYSNYYTHWFRNIFPKTFFPASYICTSHGRREFSKA